MEPTRLSTVSGATDSEFDEVRQRVLLAQWHLEETADALAGDYDEVAALAAELTAETEALVEVLDAIEGADDRWAGVEEVTGR